MSKIAIDDFLNKFTVSRNFLKDSDVHIEVNEDTYLPPGEMEAGWLYNIYERLASHKCSRSIESMAIVGIGPGVEALLFVEVFEVKKLFCFDINKGVLNAAKDNILKNLKIPGDINLVVEQSNLLDYLVKNNIRVELIYENLPNLRLFSNLPLIEGSKTASFYSEGENEDVDVPDMYDSNMLRLHYRFLLQAKRCLLPNGNVICCIGARIPISVIESMFISLGYTFKIMHLGVVQQLNAKEVVDTYREIEENSKNSFLFLPHRDGRVRELIRKNSGESDKSSLFESLRKIGFNASEAHLELVGGRSVDHIGLIVEGTIKDSD